MLPDLKTRAGLKLSSHEKYKTHLNFKIAPRFRARHIAEDDDGDRPESSYLEYFQLMNLDITPSPHQPR